MKVLVTGATGLLGSHIVERLVAQGYQVRALARKTSDIGHLRSTGVEIVFGDIENRNSLPPALKGIKVVFHAAARVTPGGAPGSSLRLPLLRALRTCSGAALMLEFPAFFRLAQATYTVKPVAEASLLRSPHPAK